MAKPATFFANFPVNKQLSYSEMIRRYRSTYEGCDLVPPVTSSIGDSELLIHFQEAYASLFPNCCNKQTIQSNLPSYTPIKQGTICAKVYPEGIQPIKGNNCGLIPARIWHCMMDCLHFIDFLQPLPPPPNNLILLFSLQDRPMCQSV